MAESAASAATPANPFAAGSAADTPRSAYKQLEIRATLLTCGLLVALAAAAWWSTAVRSRGMTDMVQGLSSVRSAMMSFDMSVGLFMAMWTTMMVAMMFPTIAPIVLLHRMVMRRAHRGIAPTIAFVAGYLVIWTVSGLVPLAVLLTFRHVTQHAGWVAPVSGLVLAVAGAYQFTRWKDVCQRACRSPMTFLMTHNFGGGRRGLRGAFRTGVVHGLFCLGCCWALMAVLLVVGLMNLAWMAAIAVVFLAEKNWRYGPELTKLVGGGLVLLGAAILIHPALLSTIG